ncbi:MAG: 1,4-alpha-glucan-branching enzyme [Bacteroidetes bacterium]|nr:MAG: 1,4-alpha-glucan-branching enzyme [Bacteroidota bacterium]
MPATPQKLAILQDDPWLEPFEAELLDRLDRYQKLRAAIEAEYGSLRAFARGHQYLGFNYDAEKGGWWYREWAPAARALFLTGDFNGWNRSSHPLQQAGKGVWEIFLPNIGNRRILEHGHKVKVHVIAANGATDRIPAYITRAVQDPRTHDFSGQIWQPEEAFPWTDAYFDPAAIETPLIYESHTGMAQEKEGVGTYREFANNIIPRIKSLGYNTIQLMAVQEHPYYGSFGYHVSNFFAPSSRFGTPEDLKYLVNTAHAHGIAVIMDIVHSHAVKNFAEGLNLFDGSEEQYFHPGGRGHHPDWDSKLFNYGKREVQQFLLSNVAWWLEEFHFDGFRFDGVTSMLYFHHGNTSFETYDKYFGEGVEWDAITYLQLANELAHEIRPGVLTIAEDMSGMPGGCRPVSEGGIGFDYRLAMGIPDNWIKIIKHQQDEDWNIYHIWHFLTNRRNKEKNIAYAESHDQALVGDKTLAFWLMDKEMYWHMQVDDRNLVVDRGIALHKIIRLLTASLGGEGYLTFMGNEFGHPEWVDFPREGNNWSYKYARRQWSLADNEQLKYQFLLGFDREMLTMLQSWQVPAAAQAKQLHMDEEGQVLCYERAGLIFAINLHPTRSVTDYAFYVPKAGGYRVILDTDDTEVGGHGRVDSSIEHFAIEDEHGTPFLSLYLPNRVGLVLQKT